MRGEVRREGEDRDGREEGAGKKKKKGKKVERCTYSHSLISKDSSLTDHQVSPLPKPMACWLVYTHYPNVTLPECA